MHVCVTASAAVLMAATLGMMAFVAHRVGSRDVMLPLDSSAPVLAVAAHTTAAAATCSVNGTTHACCALQCPGESAIVVTVNEAGVQRCSCFYASRNNLLGTLVNTSCSEEYGPVWDGDERGLYLRPLHAQCAGRGYDKVTNNSLCADGVCVQRHGSIYQCDVDVGSAKRCMYINGINGAVRQMYSECASQDSFSRSNECPLTCESPPPPPSTCAFHKWLSATEFQAVPNDCNGHSVIIRNASNASVCALPRNDFAFRVEDVFVPATYYHSSLDPNATNCYADESPLFPFVYVDNALAVVEVPVGLDFRNFSEHKPLRAMLRSAVHAYNTTATRAMHARTILFHSLSEGLDPLAATTDPPEYTATWSWLDGELTVRYVNSFASYSFCFHEASSFDTSGLTNLQRSTRHLECGAPL